MRAYLGHAIGTALLGGLLPSGEHLGPLHRLATPIVELIPNAIRLTNRTPDPIFAQTFVGFSLAIAFVILIYFIVAVRGYRTRTFDGTWQRTRLLLFIWGTVLVLLLSFWFLPYMDPVGKGRAYLVVQAATSSKLGLLTAMNQLIVGFPLVCILTLWAAHTCTAVRGRTSYF
jgi:heme/copper-type cytochrome/quinol oxidase subunit 4